MAVLGEAGTVTSAATIREDYARRSSMHGSAAALVERATQPNRKERRAEKARRRKAKA
jgi:hypothetical protein